MNRFAFIHTGAVVIPEVSRLAAQYLPGIEHHHLLDDRIVGDLRAGASAREIHERLRHLAAAAKHAGASTVMLTCSSVSEFAAGVQETVDIPVLRIDEAMADEAVATGDRIAVLATLPTTLTPTVGLLRERAALADRPVELIEALVHGAFEAVTSGDREKHDELVAATIVERASQVDVIVLAQASMASAAAAVTVDVPVLTSPELGIRRAAQGLAA